MTFLRWAGSKKQILDTLSCCWYASRATGKSGRYIEAFSGSAALFFRLQPEQAILVDVNAELQSCMGSVLRRPYAVHNELQQLPNSAADYYRIRAMDPNSLTAARRTARFIYLNRYCFNGLYRTNRNGDFNVPYGANRSGDLPTANELAWASRCLKRAVLKTGDFYEVLSREIRSGDFVYLDPPYAKRNTDLDNQYGPDVFGTNDIDRLMDLLNLIDKRKGHFVVSYAKCPEMKPFQARWLSHTITVKRTIAANVEHRKVAQELLLTNI